MQNDSATNEAGHASCACCRRSRFGCKCGKRGGYNLEFRDQRLLAFNRANSVATGAAELYRHLRSLFRNGFRQHRGDHSDYPVYQDALFTSGGFTVAAYAWGNGGNTQDKVTQSNNYATTINGASVHITGLGACSSLCSGFSTTLGDTEWLTLALGSHPGWSLQSIVFGDVMNSPGEQVEFWFNNDATRSAAISDKHDDTILQMGANVCVGGIGANGSCLYDFSALGVDPDNYQYLWATAVNPTAVPPTNPRS